MKKLNLMSLAKIMGLFVMAAMVTITSCKKDDTTTTTDPVIILDGLYVSGGATAYTDLNSKAMMKVTRNEVTQANRASLYELYISVKAGATGFNITKVAGSAKTVYGPAAGWANITQGTTDEPKDTFQRGTVVAGTTKFTVPKDGMYHVVIDMDLMKAVIVPVHWGMIGAATPNGWNSSTQLTESAFNLNTTTWTITNMKFNKGEFKFRYSQGWKVELDTVLDLGGGKKGVKVNTNLGGAVNALLPGGDNIVNSAPGFYTASLAYTLGAGYVATLTKTSDIPAIDYSAYQMGIIGNCYNKPGTTTPANWDENFGTSVPVKVGTTYTWTYTTDMILGEFKFRQGTDWAGKSIGYGDVTVAGAGAANFENNGGNFKVKLAANYTIVLKIDAATEVYTVTFTKN